MKSLITPLILIIAAVALFFTFTDAKYQEVKQLQVDQQVYQERFELIENLINTRDTVLAPKYNSLTEAQVTRLNKAIPRQVNNIKLINDIDRLLAKFNTKVDSFSFSSKDEGSAATNNVVAASAEPKLQSMEVTVAFAAPYATFQDILRELEKSLRFIDIESVGFTANADKTTYNYSVKFTTYWLQ